MDDALWLLLLPAIPLAGTAWTIALMGRGWREATAVFAVTVVSTALLLVPIAWVLALALTELWEMAVPLVLLAFALAGALVLIYREVRWGWWLLAAAPLAMVPLWAAALWVWGELSYLF
jgi:hypothetical protein